MTAAHCMHALDAKKIKVVFGAYGNLDNVTTDECNGKSSMVRESKVSFVAIHDGWKFGFGYSDSRSENHDIAVLKLKDKIEEFTPTIFPICLKKSEEILNIKSGIIAGFKGFSTDVPLKVELPMVHSGGWIRQRRRKLTLYSGNGKFVAGNEIAEVCPGDRGSGFFVQYDGKFYLRGLEHFGHPKKDIENCSKSSFALYTDVVQYLDDFVLKVSEV